MKSIPYRNFPVTPEMKRAVVKALEAGYPGYHTGGEQEIALEKEFAKYIGCKHAVFLTSGAGALHIAMAILGIGPGDEVITAANTFTAASDCAVWVGATPVFADIDPDIMNIDPEKMREKITPRTKAIIPAYMYGHPADLDPILEIAKAHGIPVIEDAAQAAGSKYKGKIVGGLGDIGIFSFAGKNMTAYGEGGMFTTNNPEYAQQAIMYRHFGHNPDDFGGKQNVLGFNYTMGGWNSALARITLRKLDQWNKARRTNAKMYDKLLKDISQVKLPVEREWAYHAYLHYVIRAERRDELKKYLEKKGIDPKIHYPIPIPLQPAYSRFGFKEGMFPESEKSANSILSLPTRFTLTKREVETIAKSIRAFYA